MLSLKLYIYKSQTLHVKVSNITGISLKYNMYNPQAHYQYNAKLLLVNQTKETPDYFQIM